MVTHAAPVQPLSNSPQKESEERESNTMMCEPTSMDRSSGTDDRGAVASAAGCTSSMHAPPDDVCVSNRCGETLDVAVARAAPDGRRLFCAHCSDSFYAERMLHLHERLVHTRTPALHCLHCQAAFGHIADLNLHLLAEHTRLRKHPCGSCLNVSYPTYTQLRRHASATHQGDLPWRK